MLGPKQEQQEAGSCFRHGSAYFALQLHAALATTATDAPFTIHNDDVDGNKPATATTATTHV